MPPPSTPTTTTVSASSIVPLAAVDETKAIELGGQSTGSVSTRVALPASAVALTELSAAVMCIFSASAYTTSPPSLTSTATALALPAGLPPAAALQITFACHSRQHLKSFRLATHGST